MVLVSISCYAQSVDADYFDEREGLSGSFVNDLKTDQHGQLLIATDRGLSVFNGHEFTNYTVEDGLADGYVSTIAVGKHGEIWLGHLSGAVTRYDGSKFLALANEEAPQRIETFLPIGTEGNFLAVGQRGSFIKLNDGGAISIHSSLGLQTVVHTACALNDSMHLLGTDSGLFALHVAEGKSKFQALDFAKSANVKFLLQIRTGLAVVVLENGLFLLEFTEDGMRWNPLPTEAPLEPKEIECLTLDSSGTLMVFNGTEVFAFSIIGEPFKLELHAKTMLGHSLIQGTAQTMASGRDALWLGTRGHGLIRIKTPAVRTFNALHNPQLKHTKAVLQIEEKKWIIGTDDRCLLLSEYASATSPYELNLLQDDLSIRTICQSSAHQFFAGTKHSGVWSFSTIEVGQWQKVLETTDRINHVSIDNTGRLWVATTTQGVYILDSAGNIETNLSMRDGLSHNNVKSIFHDTQGYHWLSTEGGQLTMLQPSGKLKKHFGPTDGISSVDFKGISEDKNRAIWLATGDDGIFRQNASGSFERGPPIPALIGRPIEIFAIKHDQADLMVVADGGFCMVNSEDHRVVYLRKINAFTAEKPDHHGVQLNGFGSVVIAQPNGFSHWKPQEIELQNSPNKILIKTQVNEVFKTIGGEDLNYGIRRIRFHFDAIDIASENEPLYWYRLLGFENEWVGPTLENHVNYTNLTEGEYTFEVRSGLTMAQPDSAPRILKFAVLPPFYRTWWFISLVVIAGLLLIAFVVKLREHRLKQANIRLDAEVTQRTKELQAQNEKIKEFTYMVSHDLKAPVNNLSGLISMFKSGPPLEEDRQEIMGMIENAGNQMGENLDRLMTIIQKAENPSDQLSEVDIEEVFNEVCASLSTLISASATTFKVAIEHPVILFEKQALASILHNLISNAVKYRASDRAPEIGLTVKKRSAGIEIMVSDNGLGIDLSTSSEALFNKLERIHTDAEGSGLGLHLTKKLIESHGGQINVQSTLGTGSTFIVFLPLIH